VDAYRMINRERRAEYHRSWYAANKKRRIEYQRAYHAANPNIRRTSQFRYRSRIRNAEGTHTAVDIQNQYKAQKGKCYWCSVKVGDTYHVDHIKPLSRGGSNNPENLVIACPSCNLSKGSKLPHEWAQGGRLL
jgi:5-methylcytosine-specific restriction endonuclease McrA